MAQENVERLRALPFVAQVTEGQMERVREALRELVLAPALRALSEKTLRLAHGHLSFAGNHVFTTGNEYIDEGEGMTRSRKIAEPRDEEQHRSKARTDHRIGKSQRTRPARRDAGGHPKPTHIGDRHSEVAAPTAGPSSARALEAESARAGNDRLSDVAAVSLIVLSCVWMVEFFVGLAVGI